MNRFHQSFSQLKHRQQLLAILVFTLVAIVVWIGVTLVTSQQTTKVSAELLRMAKPLTPTLNRSVLDEIKRKPYYDTNQLTNFPIVRVLKETKKTRSSTASPSSTPAATPNSAATSNSAPTAMPSPTSTFTPSPTPAATPSFPTNIPSSFIPSAP